MGGRNYGRPHGEVDTATPTKFVSKNGSLPREGRSLAPERGWTRSAGQEKRRTGFLPEPRIDRRHQGCLFCSAARLPAAGTVPSPARGVGCRDEANGLSIGGSRSTSTLASLPATSGIRLEEKGRAPDPAAASYRSVQIATPGQAHVRSRWVRQPDSAKHRWRYASWVQVRAAPARIQETEWRGCKDEVSTRYTRIGRRRPRYLSP